MIETSVLIVGGGPVGLALAGDLGWRGVNSLLLEKSDGIIAQARMDMIGIRSMEFCRRWGIVPWVEAAGYNRDYPQDCAWVTDLNGYEFGREHFPSPREEPAPAFSPQKRERCPQNFFDPVLSRFAQRSGHADLRYCTTLLSFEEDGDHVLAQVRNEATQQTYEVRARYLIGCDGGASTVRQALGIKMEGEGVLTFTTNVIFRCDGLEKLHKMQPAYRYIFIGPEGTWATLVAINGRDQWRFSLVGDDEKRVRSEDELREAIVRAVGREFDFEILSVLPWVRRQLVAEHYRKGKVFLAGDAAHLTSPTGGFGMNTGLLDIVNLGWKLEAVLKGWGGDYLLDSYELEQHPVAVRNVTEAGENLRRMLSPRIVRPDAGVFDADNPDLEQARVEYGNRYTEMMKREWFSVGVHLGYVYENSPIVVPDGSAAPPNEVARYTPTARPGSRAPHVWLSPEHSTLDAFGRTFVLLHFGQHASKAQDFLETAQRLGVPVERVQIENEAAAALYEKQWVLVRPDGSVAWRDDVLPEDALALLDQVRGAVAPTAAQRVRRDYQLAEV